MKRSSGLFYMVLFLVVLLFLPDVVCAENYDGPSDPTAIIIPAAAVLPDTVSPETYGTANLINLTLSAWDFQPISSEVTYQYTTSPFSIYRTNASGDVWFEAPLHLPAGALVSQVEIHYCDTGTGVLSSWLVETPKSNGASTYHDIIASSGTPGCVVQTGVLATPVTVDNNNYSYTIEVNMGADDSTITLASARVGYNLQISPAPGTATFSDVPISHPFFQHIEALAASGITTGYGDGTFRPGDYVTRQAMAAFLARALGLHWPN